MRVDPQRLIRLAVLIQHGSFKQAASHLGVTQPALSQSIAQIEREVGVKLIDRTPHGVEPTIYGRILYEHARSIDRELVQAAQHIRELASGKKSALKVGVTVGAAASLAALTICRLQPFRSGIDTRISEEPTIRSLLTRLQDRTVDILICQRPREVDLKGARALALCRVRRVLCVRTGHPLTGPVKLNDISAYPFVCPQDEIGELFGLSQIFSTIGLDPARKIIISNSIYVAKEMVLNSDAFGIFSDLSVLSERRLNLFRLIDLETPTEYWMQLILRSEQTPTDLIKDFVRELVCVCRDLNIDVHPGAVRFQDLRPLVSDVDETSHLDAGYEPARDDKIAV